MLLLMMGSEDLACDTGVYSNLLVRGQRFLADRRKGLSNDRHFVNASADGGVRGFGLCNRGDVCRCI